MARRTIRELAMRLGPRQTGKAIASALNRVSAMGKTKASSQIRSRYRIKKGDLDKRMGTTKASWKHQKASIYSHGVPIPVHLFKPRQTKKGVRVTILGKSNTIPHAFMATMRSGHRGVFARGHYTASGFEFRHKRKRDQMNRTRKNDLPITQLTTISQGPMFSHPTVIQPVISRVEDMLGIRIEHELNAILAGYRV